MYDVLYLDHSGHSNLLASMLDRDAATELARCEARRRHGGRMFLVGSEQPRRGMVLIVKAGGPQRHVA